MGKCPKLQMSFLGDLNANTIAERAELTGEYHGRYHIMRLHFYCVALKGSMESQTSGSKGKKATPKNIYAILCTSQVQASASNKAMKGGKDKSKLVPRGNLLQLIFTLDKEACLGKPLGQCFRVMCKNNHQSLFCEFLMSLTVPIISVHKNWTQGESSNRLDWCWSK